MKKSLSVSTKTVVTYVNGEKILCVIEHKDEFNVNSGDVIGVDKIQYKTVTGHWLGSTIIIDGDKHYHVRHFGEGEKLIQLIKLNIK